MQIYRKRVPNRSLSLHTHTHTHTTQAMNRNDDDFTATENGRNSAGRNVGLTRPSLTTPRRSTLRRPVSGEAESLPRSTSRLHTHESDDGNATPTPSIISQSGERSLQMPEGRTETTLVEGSGAVGAESQALSIDDATVTEEYETISSSDVTHQEYVPHEGERGWRPSLENKKAVLRLELAPERAPDNDDLPRRHDVSGSSQREDEGGTNFCCVAHSPLVEDDQPTSAMEEGEGSVQPGAYHVEGIRARHDATSEQAGIAEGGALSEDHDDGALSAQLVDPDAQQLQLNRQVEMQVRREVRMVVDERLAQQGNNGRTCCIVAGVDCSKCINQLLCLLLFALASVSLLAALLATGRIGPQSSSVAATSASGSNTQDVSGSQSGQPSLSRMTRSPFQGPGTTVLPSVQPSARPVTSPPMTVSPVGAAPVTWAPSTPGAVHTTASPTFSPTPRPVTSAPETLAPIAPTTITPSVHVAEWVKVGNDIDGESPDDLSGSSVALSSNGAVLAIGAIWNSGGGANSGHVRVYINTEGGWEQRGGDLDGSEEENSGYSVALSADGTIVAVGAIVANGINNTDSGQVQVYRWISSSWQPLGSSIDGDNTGDQFGYSVALSNDGAILAVGGRSKDAGATSAGHVRIFALTGTDWNQRGNDLDGSSAFDFFGDSVSLSADGAIVACGAEQGYARVHRWTGSTWQQLGPTLLGVASNDGFGESVSLSGDGGVVAVGADSGNYAVIFRNDGTDWVQIGQTIAGVASGDRFGFSISLSFDGNTVLIGGWGNDSNGESSGHALVYRLSPNGQEWVRLGQGLVGEAAGARFGVSTSISDDGTRIAIGAPFNGSSKAGQVRVYDLT